MNEKTSYTTSIFKTDFAKRQSLAPRQYKLITLSLLLVLFTATYYVTAWMLSADETQSHHSLETVRTHSEALTLTKPLNLPSPKPLKSPNSSQKTTNESRKVAFTIKSGDSLSSLFATVGIAPGELHQLMQQASNANSLRLLHPGQQLNIQLNKDGKLIRLTLKMSPTESLIVSKNPKGDFVSRHEFKHFETITRFASATIQDSLFLAGQKAGLDQKLIMELARIFSWDIDFVLDIRPGDTFKVLYEENYLDGKKFAVGNILAAEFINQNKAYHAIRFTNKKGSTDYFTMNGKSLRKAFIRTPVNFTRISSRFSYGRKHPILHRIRAHKGVDYAAPRGTPVKTTGDGKVIFVGRKGGYGKAIIIKHGQRYSTLYGHLNHFARDLHRGKLVSQGDVIGYVGSTGLATGPHLHYEFHVNGIQRDPLRVALPQAKPVPSSELKYFSSLRDNLIGQLKTYGRLQVAVNGDKNG